MNVSEMTALMREIDFPREAVEKLSADYEKLTVCPETAALLGDREEKFAAGEHFSFYSTTEELQTFSEKTDVHPFSSDMLFYLHLAPILREKYRERGLPDEWFLGAMEDLRCKLFECRRVYGIWGSFVAIWFARFYDFSLYAIGRLEFCLIRSPFDYEKNGLSIAKGQLCIDVHIPSKGRLVRSELKDAYDRAAAFFAPRLDAPVAFHCESWLLFEHHAEMLPPDSGIFRFAGDYTYMRKAPDEGDLWRIFGGENTDCPEELSEDTALKRAYKQWLLEKKPVYGGEGIFFHRDFKE